jgi:hypothetical protein
VREGTDSIRGSDRSTGSLIRFRPMQSLGCSRQGRCPERQQGSGLRGAAALVPGKLAASFVPVPSGTGGISTRPFRLFYCVVRPGERLVTEAQEALAERLWAVPEPAAKLRRCVRAGRRDRCWLRDSLQQLRRRGSIDRRDLPGLWSRSSWSRDSAPHPCRSHDRCESYGVRRGITVIEGTERSCPARHVRRHK